MGASTRQKMPVTGRAPTPPRPPVTQPKTTLPGSRVQKPGVLNKPMLGVQQPSVQVQQPQMVNPPLAPNPVLNLNPMPMPQPIQQQPQPIQQQPQQLTPEIAQQLGVLNMDRGFPEQQPMPMPFPGQIYRPGVTEEELAQGITSVPAGGFSMFNPGMMGPRPM